jgi:hypothetical protein
MRWLITIFKQLCSLPNHTLWLAIWYNICCQNNRPHKPLRWRHFSVVRDTYFGTFLWRTKQINDLLISLAQQSTARTTKNSQLFLQTVLILIIIWNTCGWNLATPECIWLLSLGTHDKCACILAATHMELEMNVCHTISYMIWKLRASLRYLVLKCVRRVSLTTSVPHQSWFHVTKPAKGPHLITSQCFTLKSWWQPTSPPQVKYQAMWLSISRLLTCDAV